MCSDDTTSPKKCSDFFFAQYIFKHFFVHTANEMAHKRRVQLIFLPCVIKKGLCTTVTLLPIFPLPDFFAYCWLYY